MSNGHAKCWYEGSTRVSVITDAQHGVQYKLRSRREPCCCEDRPSALAEAA